MYGPNVPKPPLVFSLPPSTPREARMGLTATSPTRWSARREARMSRTSRGHNRERQVRKLLEERGWWVARAAGSLGDADLVAMRASTEDGELLIGVDAA